MQVKILNKKLANINFSKLFFPGAEHQTSGNSELVQNVESSVLSDNSDDILDSDKSKTILKLDENSVLSKNPDDDLDSDKPKTILDDLHYYKMVLGLRKKANTEFWLCTTIILMILLSLFLSDRMKEEK